jgi:hypothetical protein
MHLLLLQLVPFLTIVRESSLAESILVTANNSITNCPVILHSRC